MKQFTFRAILVAFALVIGSSGLKADSYEVLYGTISYDTDETTILGVSEQGDFAGDANEKTGVTFSDANGNTSTLPIDGSVLFANTSAGWTKYFSTPITQGCVYFSGIYSISANNNQTFNIVDENGYKIFSSANNNTSKNGDLAVATICGEEIINYVRQPRTCAYGVKSLCIDLDTRTVSYELIVSSGNGTTTTLSGTKILPAEVTSVQGLSVAKTSYGCYLDNVKLYSRQSEEIKYSFTINYKLGEEVKNTQNGEAVDGAVIYPSNLVTDETGNRYFVNDESEYFTVSSSGSNVFDVTVRNPYSCTLNVSMNVAGGQISSSSTVIEEDDDRNCSWSYSYPIYKSKDGVYFKADYTETFGETGTFTNGDVIDKTVTYSNADPSIVFFSEESTISGSGMTYSNGTKGHVAAQNKRDRGIFVGTLPAGVYTLEAEILAANGRGLVIRHSTDDPLTELTTTRNDNSTAGYKTSEFTLATNTESLFINGRNSGDVKTNQSEDFDYVLVRKLADLASVSSAGFATYSPTKNVVVPAEDVAEVYTASVSGETVNLTAVPAGTALLAGTGYVVKAPEGSVRFDLTSGDASAIEGNDLKVAGEGGVEATEASAYYVLAKRSNDQVGFTLVASGVVIPQGKAYLDLGAMSAKPAFIGIDGSTTAIQTLPSADADDAFYSLQGVKTAKPAKGIYINNGKKVVVKH